jgi:hypothetical protein
MLPLALAAAILTVSAAAENQMPPLVRKVFLPPRHDVGNTGIVPNQPIDAAAWIWYPGKVALTNLPHAEDFMGGWEEPAVLRFRNDFTATASPLRIHVSADERFELYVDGHRIARGPDLSDVDHWCYATYDVSLAAGEHRMEALVWSVGPYEPLAQMSWHGGLVLKAEGEYDAQLTTGTACWKVTRLRGYEFAPGIFYAGGQMSAYDCGPQWNEGSDGDYVEAAIVRSPICDLPYGEAAPGWKLYPTQLPDQLAGRICVGRAVAAGPHLLSTNQVLTLQESRDPALPEWQSLVAGSNDVVVPANAQQFVLWDLGNYYCAYPFCEVSGGGGAELTWGWAEAPYLPQSEAKGQRDEFVGKTFRGLTDKFLPAGGAHRKFSTLSWRAGRWCLIGVKTGNEPLTLHRLALDITRYPYENESRFENGDPELAGVLRLAVRGLQMCSHDTYIDCPYYERLMYVGDTRMDLLATYASSHDDRLARRAIELFDFSRRNWGIVSLRYPAHSAQHSPTFALFWPLMLWDYTYWRNDPEFVRVHSIGLRSMLAHYEVYLNRDGLLHDLPGWPFMDWVPEWSHGNAPDGVKGISSLNNLLCVYALQKSADIEEFLDEPLLAQRLRENAARTATAVRTRFWDESRGLLADNLAHTEFSEHGQCLALLTDTLAGAQPRRCFDNLLTAPDLKRATIYFSFYLMETWRKFGRGDLILDRMGFWKDLVEKGLKTPVEKPGDTRSDCHAWGSHPLFDLPASVAGIRPASPCFRTVRVEPQPGNAPKILCRIPHPDGFIAVDLKFKDGRCDGTVDLPPRITGVFVWHGQQHELTGGTNAIHCK